MSCITICGPSTPPRRGCAVVFHQGAPPLGEGAEFLRQAGAIEPGTAADVVTLDCVRAAASQELELADLARAEYTVTPMQDAGPATFLALAARSVLVDATAAEAYLVRLRRSGTWFDQLSDRLRAGADRGRLPVASLAEQAVTWAGTILAGPAIESALAPRVPQGWARAAAWEAECRAVAEQVVRPALGR